MSVILLISPSVIEPIQKLKIQNLGNKNPRLHSDEILIALSICAATDEVSEKAKELIGRNSRIAQNQDEYQEEYSRLSDEYHKLKEKLDAVEAVITDKETRRTRAKEFIAILRKTDTITDSFSPELFIGLVERMTVVSQDEIRVEFRNGTAVVKSV